MLQWFTVLCVEIFFKPLSLGGFGTVRVARVELEPESPEVNYVAPVVLVGEQKCDNNVAILWEHLWHFEGG